MVKSLGVDPVHFGMIMMVNLGIGLITPPVGTRAVRRLRPSANCAMGVIVRAMVPFFVALFIVLMLVTYIPWLSLWLPRTMGL